MMNQKRIGVMVCGNILLLLAFLGTNRVAQSFSRPLSYQKHHIDAAQRQQVQLAESFQWRLHANDNNNDSTATADTANTLLMVNAENRGDARGAALLLEELSVYRGSSKILSGVDWRIEPKTKWALIGANGSGKSTLLQAIVGDISHADGTLTVGSKQEVGYLKQTAVAGSTRSIFEEAASGMTQIAQAQAAMDKAVAQGDLEGLERATARFEAVGGYKQEQKVASVLKGLGFDDIHTMRCDELSGGWQMRVAFARLLLSEPTLCLMDEPSNHLDAAAKKWLARYLSNYQGAGAMILVTHDAELLESMDHIAEVIPDASKSLQIYKSCTYSQYLQLKAQRAAAAVTEYERNSEKAAKLQAFVDRFGASATKASAAQSRVKQIEKMKREGLLDAPAEEVIAQRFKPTLELPPPPKAIGDVLVALKNADIGYEDGKVLVSNVNLEVTKGMKLLIRGPNGAGKSTVLHSLRGKIPLLTGEKLENQQLRMGMFTQDLAQELDPQRRAVDLVTAYAREGGDGDIFVSDQAARNTMGRLGLQGEKPLRHICDLSGGEKARVALAMFALKPSNVYLLDEASNHLDVECVEALSNALSDWGDKVGALVVVSHDRNFCDNITFTHVATVKDGTFRIEARGARPSDWVINDLGAAANAAEANENAEVPSVQEIDPQLRKLAYNAPKRIAKIEQLIEQTEGKIEDIDAEMMTVGSDVGKLVDLNKSKEALQEKVDEYMVEWEELEEVLAQVSQLS